MSQFDDLISAIQGGNSSTVEGILDQNTPNTLLTDTDGNGYTALHHAAQAGYSAIITLLLGRNPSTNGQIDIEAMDPTNKTPLYISVAAEKLGALQTLTTAGANVDAPNDDDKTPLWIAGLKEHGTVDDIIIYLVYTGHADKDLVDDTETRNYIDSVAPDL